MRYSQGSFYSLWISCHHLFKDYFSTFDCKGTSVGQVLGVLLLLIFEFPGGSEDKASACHEGDPGSIPGSVRSPGEGNGNPLQWRSANLLPGGFHGQRSLAGCRPWGCKELDKTKGTKHASPIGKRFLSIASSLQQCLAQG